MARSKVSICNAALTALGAGLITSLTENSESARACNARLDDMVDEVIRAHAWGCAVAQTELAQNIAAPIFGFSYSYALPTSPYCLRVLKLSEEDSGYVWRITGRNLETDSETANIDYLKRITDVTEMDADLTEAIAARLAAEVAYRLTGNSAIRDMMWKVYASKINEAKDMDAREGKEGADYTDSWISARS